MSARFNVIKLFLIGVVGTAVLTGGLILGNASTHQTDDPDILAATAALSIARHVRSLTESAGERTRADMSAETIAASKAAIEIHAESINQHLEVLSNGDHVDAVTGMRSLLDELTFNASRLEEGRSQFARSLRDSQNIRQKLIAETSWKLIPAAVASEDDLFYRLISDSTDVEQLTSKTSESVTAEELLLYNRLALLKQQIDQGYIVLEVATRQTDSEFIGTVEENVNLAMYQLRENLVALSNIVQEDLDPTLVPLANDLVDAAYGDANLIDLMKTRLRLSDQEAQIADYISEFASSLHREIYAVLDDVVARMELTDSKRDIARALKATLALSQHVTAAESSSSDETSVSTPISELAAVRETFNSHIEGIHQELAELGEIGYEQQIAHLHSEVDRVELITEHILNGRTALSEALKSAASERARLRSFVDHELEPAVVSSMDNQLYYMLTGRSEFREEDSLDSNPLSNSEFLRYWHLASVNESIFRTFSGLIIAIIMTDATLIGEGEERFITASHRLEKSIDFLEKTGGSEVDSQLVPLARQFIAFGNGESNVFDALRYRLPLIAIERELIQSNHSIFGTMQIDIDALLDSILADVTPAS